MARGIVKVVGLSFRNVRTELKPNYKVNLLPEPDNKYDPLAVVVKDTNGETLGYVGKDDPYRAVVLSATKPLQAKVLRANYYAEGEKGLWDTVKVGDLVQLWLEVESDIYDEAPVDKGVLLEAFVGGSIWYNDATHSYYNDAGEKYLSGSEYAKQFDKPFNAEMIAGVMAKKVDGVTAQQIQDVWELNAKVSRDFGTALHGAMELYEAHRDVCELLDKQYHIHSHPVIKNAVESFYVRHKDETAKQEVLVVSQHRKWAGRIDRLLIVDEKKKICRVQDYKTNADIEKHLPIYWKQLNFYGQILADAGWTVDGLDIFHYNGTWKEYEVVFVGVKDV